ncbi:hypothetical protein V2K54_08945 [Pseudomonas alliivorans]|uniref:DUF4354 family protein n=1 Tax=Pseudomonas alliivorans TaxID=2810613 RepID=A0ABS4C0B9_9PSED|nr:hypothetical protein [Pseudomonas alliivorans]MBP0938708.1 hypothetical protein [Pseudomonas alliivorans]MBP0944067.1 hypothetical protein [Pseudomonas alliivorans]MEE4325641.1 hypothetical protein [Pseudomonas alliivorans]MEE4367171.1 hypothetical protein [Pseudomonas alliivorans]MEE4618652.1 hypothetical protein [Pseudomonas alliivorans]
MNTCINALLVSCALAASTGAVASPALHTATIDQQGRVVAQSSAWVKSVNLTNQKDYFATYEVMFMDGLFKQAPGFCSVSSIDTSDYDRLLYGHAKLGGAATTEKVNVLGLMVGKNEPAGDSAMSFQLACTH